MAKQAMLTTFDNPFNPFDQFESWYLFDIEKGYNCCEVLAKFEQTSNQFAEIQNDQEQERAIDEIIQYDLTNVYRKVTREVTYKDEPNKKGKESDNEEVI